jgi:LacI family transcriptional regulator
MAITRDDVAKLAGVSPATVSYVMNNGPRPVSEETRRRVLLAIEQLSYRPNTIARSLKTKKTFTAGIIVSDILNPTLASIEKSIEDLFVQNNYSLTICNSDESPDREKMWLEMLRDRRVDGIILLPTGANRSSLFATVDSGFPLVLLDRQIEGLRADAVLFDNDAGAYQAVKHLLSLGHTRIGLLNLPASLTPGQGRLRGYERALTDSNLPIYHQLIKEGSFKAQDGSMLAAALLDANPRPTALLVSSNRLAQGVLEQVKARGMRIPDDLALIIFDDVAYYSFITPSITAVSADAKEFGARAVEYLIERINGSYTGPPRTYLVPCHLNARESTLGISVVAPRS